MTVINPNSISGITSITLPSGGDNVLTIHTNDGVERFRIDSSGNVKIGTAATISPDGDLFVTGVCTATTLSGAASGLTGALPAIDGSALTGIAATDNVRTGILDVAGIATFRNDVNIGAAVTISESGIEASGIGITCANINGTQIGGRRNLWINGACLVNQRGSSSTSEGYQTIDRFYVGSGGTDEAPTQAQVDVASGTTPYTLGFRKALKITNGNQTSGAGTADFMYLKYCFEAQDIANSGWNYLSSSSNVTLSFWVKSSVAQSFKAYFHTRQGTEYQYPFETGSLSADTWTKVTKTISGNSNLTFNSDNGLGLELYIWSFIGTDYTASSVTEDAWSTYSNSARMKDATSTWYTTNDATLEFTGFQFEVGSQATAFEHHSFAEELIACKRYFQNHAPSDGSDHMMWGTGRAESNTGRIGIPVAVPMRAAPTVAATQNRLMRYDGTGSDSTSTPTVYSTGNWISEANVYTIDFPGHSLSHNNMYMLTCSSGSGITLDSEL